MCAKAETWTPISGVPAQVLSYIWERCFSLISLDIVFHKLTSKFRKHNHCRVLLEGFPFTPTPLKTFINKGASPMHPQLTYMWHGCSTYTETRDNLSRRALCSHLTQPLLRAEQTREDALKPCPLKLWISSSVDIPTTSLGSCPSAWSIKLRKSFHANNFPGSNLCLPPPFCPHTQLFSLFQPVQ